MKHTIKKVLAVVLALAVFAVPMTGCTDLLFSMADYYDSYEDYYNAYGDYGDSGYMDYFSQLYGDYYGYSDYSDYYTDQYYGEDQTSGGVESDYQDFYNYFSEYYEDTAETTGEGSEPIEVTTISSNILGEALRDKFTTIKGNGRDTVTIMVFMCGSNLESESGLASEDLKEMARATANSKINIIVECGGASKWKTSGISANYNTRLIIKDGKITVLEKASRADMTDGNTLKNFINFCSTNYQANRNMLILWDHGSGAVDGWGYDETCSDYTDTLTIDELGEALYATGVKFDFIGFDACLMSTMEVACVLYDFADYMIASEDYESGYGWEYQYWISELAKNTSTPTPELAKTICDDFVTESGSSSAIMAIVDLSYMKLVYSSWKNFLLTDAAQEKLLDANFSWETENTSRVDGKVGTKFDWGDLLGSIISTEAEVNDMLAIAEACSSIPESEAVISALENAIIYCSANSQDATWTGMAVTLPYGDSATYTKLKTVFRNAGFDDEYITVLGKFTSVTSGSLYDWSSWYDSYDGYDSWSDYFTGGNYDDSGYGWDSWYGWDDYNSNDYGWSDYDYYDYLYGDGSYDSYDFFDYYEFFDEYFGLSDYLEGWGW